MTLERIAASMTPAIHAGSIPIIFAEDPDPARYETLTIDSCTPIGCFTDPFDRRLTAEAFRVEGCAVAVVISENGITTSEMVDWIPAPPPVSVLFMISVGTPPPPVSESRLFVPPSAKALSPCQLSSHSPS